MKTVQVKLKSKDQDLGEFEYECPSDLEEALTTDSEEKVYALYAQQRKIRWMDAKRRELTGGGLPKSVTDALKAADPEQLRAIAAQLGVDLG